MNKIIATVVNLCNNCQNSWLNKIKVYFLCISEYDVGSRMSGWAGNVAALTHEGSFLWLVLPSFLQRKAYSHIQGYLGSIKQQCINGMYCLPTFHFSEFGHLSHLVAGEVGTNHLVVCHHTQVINKDWTIFLKRVLANRNFGF